MKKMVQMYFMLMLIFFLLVGCAGNEGQTGDGEEGAQNPEDVTLKIGVTPWTSTQPPTQVAKLILEDMGYTVEEVAADVGAVYTGLSRGDIDIFMDAWLPDMHANYMEKFGDNIEDVSTSYTEGELGWVIPTYVEGINSVEDLKGREAEFNNKMYGIDEGAGMTTKSRDMIDAYGLDIEYIASSEPAMISEAARLMKDNEPVLFLGWRPHPMFVNYDLKVLEDPKEYFKTSEVHILTHKDLNAKAPEAYEFLSNWSINIDDVESMITESDAEGKEFEELAQEWIDNNQDKVNEMTGEEE